MNRKLPTVVLAIAALGLIGFGLTRRCDSGQSRAIFICQEKEHSKGDGPPSPGYTIAIPPELLTRFSRGERVLFTADGNPDLDAGAVAMAKKDYDSASNAFSLAVGNRKNDPESQIYLENAIAHSQGVPYTLAVVAPVAKNAKSAQEMLRGVADAQARFNDSGGRDGRLLEVLIANDENDAEIAKSVSQLIADMPDVLGVVGHNSSGASLSAKAAYEKAGIAMVSPTSTSTGLKGKTFFRTAPSDAAAGEALANYVTEKLTVKNAVAFYDSESSYSQSLLRAFEKQFTGRVSKSIDLSSVPDFTEVMDNLPRQTGAILLFPSSSTKPRAFSAAKSAASSDKTSELPLLGGDTLYDADTLREGGRSIEGLVLAVPWFADTAYATKAEDRWGGRVSWRTASSFDAAQALISTLSKDVERGVIPELLIDVQLAAQQTAGSILQFDSEGERLEDPVLVRVVEGGNSPEGTDFGFELAQ